MLLLTPGVGARGGASLPPNGLCLGAAPGPPLERYKGRQKRPNCLGPRRPAPLSLRREVVVGGIEAPRGIRDDLRGIQIPHSTGRETEAQRRAKDLHKITKVIES